MGEAQDCLRLVNQWLEPLWKNPEVDGKETGWSYSGPDIERNPLAIGKLKIGLTVKGIRIQIERVLLKDDNINNVASEIVDEIEAKALTILNHAKNTD